MIIEAICDVPKKGEREYLQSADLVDWSLKFAKSHFKVGSITDLDAVFYKFLKTVPRVVARLESVEKSSLNPSVLIRGNSEQGTFRLEFFESEVPLNKTIPYIEEMLVSHMTFAPGIATLCQYQGFTLLEATVSLAKALHQHSFPTRQEKWIAVRICLKREFHWKSELELKVQLERTTDSRWTSSRIFEGGSEIGEIYFSALSGQDER